MQNLLNRWWKQEIVGQAHESVGGESNADDEYADTIQRVERRLRREARFAQASPSADFCGRTLSALQEVGSYRLAHLRWWQQPRTRAAMAACLVLGFAGLFATIASPRSSTNGLSYRGSAGQAGGLINDAGTPGFVDAMSPDGTLRALGGPLGESLSLTPSEVGSRIQKLFLDSTDRSFVFDQTLRADRDMNASKD